MNSYNQSQHQNPSTDFLKDKRRPIIGLDLDGVSADTREYFISRIENQYGVSISRRRLARSNPQIPEAGTDYSTEVENVVESDVTLYGEIEPVTGAPRATRTLSINYDIKILTHRVRDGWLNQSKQKKMEETTIDWLDNNGFRYSEFVSPTPENKTEVNADVYIDDKAGNVKDAVEEDGCIGVLFLRPHNTSYVPNGAWVASAYAGTDHQSMARNPQRQWSIITEAFRN